MGLFHFNFTAFWLLSFKSINKSLVAKKKIKRREPTVIPSLASEDSLNGLSKEELQEIDQLQKEDGALWSDSNGFSNGTIHSDIRTSINGTTARDVDVSQIDGQLIQNEHKNGSLKRKARDEDQEEPNKRFANGDNPSDPSIFHDLVNLDQASEIVVVEPEPEEYHPLLNTVYSEGTALFQRGSHSTSVIGRDKERKIIEDFLVSRLDTRGKGALYISGLPGTGKSALLNEVTKETVVKCSKKYPVRVANINCMTMESATDIFTAIHRELLDNCIQLGVDDDFYEDYDGGDNEDDGRQDIISDGHLMTDPSTRAIIIDLEKRFFSRKYLRKDQNHKRALSYAVRHVVILDEIDSIMTKDQEVLFRIFQWAFARDSSLILFGIANALDLTDRFLPRLRSSSLTPQLMPFMPYTDLQIVDIISRRLWMLVDGKYGSPDVIDILKKTPQQPPLMDRSAIMLCAKKTAANTGDLRKAFDICRRSIEIVEEDVRRKYAFEGLSPEEIKKMSDADWKKAILSGKCFEKMAELTLVSAPKATIGHVARVCSIVFGNNGTSRIKGLNLQQKAVLCALCSSERLPQFSLKITVQVLYDRYVLASSQERDIIPLSYVDYMDVVSALESHGVLSLNGVCGRKGLGSSYIRRSKGGSGSGSGKLGSVTDDFGQRRVSSSVSYQDVITELGKIQILKSFLASK